MQRIWNRAVFKLGHFSLDNEQRPNIQLLNSIIELITKL